MRLNFELPEPRSLVRLRASFEAMASTLVGRPITLKQTQRREEEDLNGEHRCFVATWSDGPVTFEERVLNGSGDPRERWGYLFELKPSALFRTDPSVLSRSGPRRDHRDWVRSARA